MIKTIKILMLFLFFMSINNVTKGAYSLNQRVNKDKTSFENKTLYEEIISNPNRSFNPAKQKDQEILTYLYGFTNKIIGKPDKYSVDLLKKSKTFFEIKKNKDYVTKLDSAIKKVEPEKAVARSYAGSFIDFLGFGAEKKKARIATEIAATTAVSMASLYLWAVYTGQDPVTLFIDVYGMPIFKAREAVVWVLSNVFGMATQEYVADMVMKVDKVGVDESSVIKPLLTKSAMAVPIALSWAKFGAAFGGTILGPVGAGVGAGVGGLIGAGSVYFGL